MELTKIHRVVAFTQRAFMLPFIKFCNDGRKNARWKNARSDFESSLYKLLANAFYGKTVENVQSEDLISELRSISDWLDTSNFQQDHPLYSAINFRTLGKFKSETANVPPTEFCGLRSKMYSLATLTSAKSFRKAKGVPKSYVKKNARH